MSEINLLLLCRYCGKFFKSPIVLPCGETICMEHVRNLVSRTSQENATKRDALLKNNRRSSGWLSQQQTITARSVQIVPNAN